MGAMIELREEAGREEAGSTLGEHMEREKGEHTEEPLAQSNLRELFDLFGTDKGYAHDYTGVYEGLFPSTLSRMRVKRVLELGVKTGASLLAWARWFPNAKIFGLDLEPCVKWFDGRFEIIQGDQTDWRVLNKLASLGPFNLIIDDCSHVPIHQLVSFYSLFPRAILPNGFYVIEDIFSPSIAEEWKKIPQCVVFDRGVSPFILPEGTHSIIAVVRRK